MLQKPSFWIIALAVVVLAVVLDELLVRYGRRLWSRGRTLAQPAAAEPRVYFMGAFSPVLTLLRYGWLPRPAPPAAEATAQPQAPPRAASPRPPSHS